MKLIEHDKKGLKADIWVFSTRVMGASAITLPVPFKHIVILVGSKRDWLNDKRLQIHEYVHVNQYARMGLWHYYAAHIWARIHSFSIYAVKEPIEAEAYKAELEVKLPEDVFIAAIEGTLAPLSPSDRLVGEVAQNGMVTRWYQRKDGSRYGLLYEAPVTP